MSEYLPDGIDITLTSTPIDQPPKKMDFGKWPVCNKCGKDMISSPDNIKTDCECGGKVTTLKNYVETVRKEKFNADEWKFDVKDYTAFKNETFLQELNCKNGYINQISEEEARKIRPDFYKGKIIFKTLSP